MKSITYLLYFMLGCSLGVVSGLKAQDFFGHIKRSLLLKLRPKDKDVINSLCDDAQVILKQFMEKTDHYGETVYLVRDVQLFSALINNHTFKKLDYYGGCDLDYCVNENLKSGRGFIVILNGKQYVAIPSPKEISADCLVEEID